MTEVEFFRSNYPIDPHLGIWRWEIPVYLFLGGIAAGVMILASVMALRRASAASEQPPSCWVRWLPFAAPILISLGMLALLLDLAFKVHVYRFYLAFKPLSPMSWGAWILMGLYPATLLLGVVQLTDGERDRVKAW